MFGVYICKLIPKITSDNLAQFHFHGTQWPPWKVAITDHNISSIFSNFKPHNLYYSVEEHINRQQNCENWLIINFVKNNGGHLGKWLLRVTMLDF